MFIVTVEHRSAYWSMCYGPFDTQVEANDFANSKNKNSYLRTMVMEVKSPDEAVS